VSHTADPVIPLHRIMRKSQSHRIV